MRDSSVIPPNRKITQTPWTDQVDPDHPLPEYPRPQLVRERWANLNGQWDYAITPRDVDQPTEFPGKITVPFPIESALSGVQRQLQPDERLWYRRSFRVPKDWEGDRVLLHFGAVDWECVVWVNGSKVGTHKGGYDPFTFDVTHTLRKDDNEIVVSVCDPSDSEPIQRGKQVLKPGFIWYTTVSGIWQTVWLEPVPTSYIRDIKLTPNLDNQTLTLSADIQSLQPGMTLLACVSTEGNPVTKEIGDLTQPLTLSIEDPIPWSPEHPFLYDLAVQLSKDGKVIDSVTSYFGMRQFSLEEDGHGTLRFCLNHKPLFLYGLLDQGYWPDGLYTPPTDEALRWEINFLKDAGFNMLRKHIKVEPARYYTHCDRAGIIVWQDMVSGGISPKPIWFAFAGLMKHMRDNHLYWRLGRGKAENRARFRDEYQRMIDARYNVVSIAIWGPFNEGWGQFDAAEIAAWTKAYDPTRLVDHASGWFDQGAGDFKSEHIYFKPLPKPPIEADRGLVLSEFGGYSLNLPDHAWNPDKDFGYKKFKNIDGLTDGYIHLLETELIPWIRSGCSAAVYTQTTDVETEVNGFLTYNRQSVKMDLDRIREIHQRLYEEGPT